MRIGACQFGVSGDICANLETMCGAAMQAAGKGVKLLVFPECALTGYPPRDIADPACVNFVDLERAHNRLQLLADEMELHMIVGTIMCTEAGYRNSAALFAPHTPPVFYHKRALWGWDADNFAAGDGGGVFRVDGWRIGVRICFEVRFPEYFRELYCAETDLNIVLFYDVSDEDDLERYALIKSHIRTRAAENVTHTLSVNAVSPFQTAPTALFDRSGRVLAEAERNHTSMLICDLAANEPDFSERGRRAFSDRLARSDC